MAAVDSLTVRDADGLRKEIRTNPAPQVTPVDRSGTIVWANQRFCRMTQRPCHELIGRPMDSFYSAAEDREKLHQAILHFDEDREDEFYLPLPDGQRLPIVYSSKRIPGEPPLSDHRVVTMIDVSRQKEAEVVTGLLYLSPDSSDVHEQNNTVAGPLTQLTHDLGGYPVWSPDGTRIAFATANGIYVMQSDGSGRQRLAVGLDRPRHGSQRFRFQQS